LDPISINRRFEFINYLFIFKLKLLQMPTLNTLKFNHFISLNISIWVVQLALWQ